ncbi:NmrA family transcriptional regulator [Nocardiopsis sp. N85]|uniref:NAD-dependent epimerase/dehydratase family protein n=1 Tax=Nocardiopsis sp. N85 TaxID=3029400 RepID=UPI00237FCA2A|nr:NAD-dependent epimerase/dehydratase family protein [Nocardiopsis sp. N85]MDE3721308.1 NmrA family transcriptional regulator [Nocardiopsis sp. N85]
MNENTIHEHILVTGGTGMTGRRVTALLTEAGVRVRVGSRAGEPRFDWHEPSTWDAVLDGVTGVYLCYHPDLAFPGAAEAVTAFAERAAAAGVRRMALLSGRGEKGAQNTEDMVLAAFPDTTVLRCSVFAQDFSESFFLPPLLEGALVLPMPDIPEPFVDLDDVARVAVRSLTEDGHGGAIHELTGPEAITFTEAVRVVGEVSGRQVRFQEVSAEEFVATMASAGAPEELAHGLVGLLEEILDGRNVEPTDGVERVLGRPATPFAEYARRAADAWR